jgi:hypothetical protein
MHVNAHAEGQEHEHKPLGRFGNRHKDISKSG